MMVGIYRLCLAVLFLALFASCGAPRQGTDVKEENKEAKALLQGIWLDDNTETALLRIDGDTIYYSDATSVPVAFKVVGDTLMTYGVQPVGYKIEKQEEYAFWFYSAAGDVIRLHKAENEIDSMTFVHRKEVPVYREVTKKDSVVIYNNTRYRGYVYINPSKIKVLRSGISEEGLGVDNQYFDNIIHICVYEGRKSLFAKDITKQMFKGIIPDDFLKWAILSDMDFGGVDARGYHYQAAVCIPDGASCYLVNMTIGTDGELHYELAK